MAETETDEWVIEFDNHSEEWVWEDAIGALNQKIKEVFGEFGANCLVHGRGMGWRDLSGSTSKEVKHAQDVIDLMPKNTPWTMRVRHDGSYGLKIRLYHHDSPTGESYYIVPWKYIPYSKGDEICLEEIPNDICRAEVVEDDGRSVTVRLEFVVDRTTTYREMVQKGGYRVEIPGEHVVAEKE